MTIPLQRLREFPQVKPSEGQVAIAFARHQASGSQSPDIEGYARQRSELIHQLVDDTGVKVFSWGETDGPRPREVVEIVVALGPTLIATLGTVLTAWIVQRRKGAPVEAPDPPPPPDTNAALAGVSILRADGARLEITYRDPLTSKQSRELIDSFMADAAQKS